MGFAALEVECNILGRGNMGWRGVVLVYGQYVGDYEDINAGAVAEPDEVTNNVTEVGLGFNDDTGREMRHMGEFDWHGSLNSMIFYWESGWEVKGVNEGICGSLLREMY